ncbi:DUF4271 domain-containing protein [Tenuifilum sp.]|uniref:DUF4271 domain-containing protein n=2 Tax=Tenuifilum sp. TaxID=2760880 RepID=UPI001B780298|nr:DUF4271 domain-containing protein [Bacteroidales bacterium]
MSAFQSSQNANNLYNNFLDLTQKYDSGKLYTIHDNFPLTSDSCSNVFKSSSFKSNITIEPKPLNHNHLIPNAYFISMVITMLIISSIIAGYAKYLRVFIQSLFYDFIAEKTLNDYSVPFIKLSRLLDFLSIISITFVVNIILEQFLGSMQGSLLFLALPALALILYRIWIWLLHKTLLLATNNASQVNYLYFHNTLNLRILMLFLIPTSLAANYTMPPLRIVFIYISIALIIIALLYRYFYFVKIFIKHRVSLLYYILYLCALELPIILGVTYLLRVS